LLKNDIHWCAQAVSNDGFHPGAEAYAAVTAYVLASPQWKTFIAD
jgi:hypothetical protein